MRMEFGMWRVRDEVGLGLRRGRDGGVREWFGRGGLDEERRRELERS